MEDRKEPIEIIEIATEGMNELEKLVFDYCQQHQIETRIKVALSAFHAPFAAQAAGKSPERVRALAEYSIRQLEGQIQLIDALFFKGRKTQGAKFWQELNHFYAFPQERVTAADRN